MITADEIKVKAKRMYPDVLRSHLTGEVFFPKTIRSDKSLSKNFSEMSRELALVISGSKDRTGYGYRVISEQVRTRLHGIQNIPTEIVFETTNDYLKFIGKYNEYEKFIDCSKLVLESFPQLISLLIKKPDIITGNFTIWNELLNVCNWFFCNFQPDLYYIRELPIQVHTKFVEENKSTLRLLLDELIPEKINKEEILFEKRYYLKYDQPVIRFRLMTGSYSDVSVPINQFILNPVICNTIYIIENKMNFLTFPITKDSMVIWGKGFALESLKNISWFDQKEIYYWSDLDVHGFQMLSQLRSYYRETKSLLMNLDILNKYKDFWVTGTKSYVNELIHLTKDEKEVYEKLRDNNIRLEQERINQDEVVKRLNDIKIYSANINQR